MKYFFFLLLLLVSTLASAQTPSIYDTWTPSVMGSMFHITITEHEIIATHSSSGMGIDLPQFLTVAPQDNPTATPQVTLSESRLEKSDTVKLLKIVYDSAKAKGRLFISTKSKGKLSTQDNKKESVILVFSFFIKDDDGELQLSFASDMKKINEAPKTLKEAEKATRKPDKNSLYNDFAFSFFNKKRTSEFTKMKDPLTMPKAEMLGMINSFGNRMAAALQTLPQDSTLFTGYRIMVPLYKNIQHITHDLFVAHGYNPLAAGVLIEKMKNDSVIEAAMKVMGDKIQESVPALRQYENMRTADSTMTPMQSSEMPPAPAPIPLPPGEGEVQQMHMTSTPLWHTNLKEALAEAKLLGKNVFIDFTGYMCTNSRVMESTIFNKAEVMRLLLNYVQVRLYTDDGSPKNDANRKLEEERFNTIAQPYYVILSPDNKLLATFPGYTRDQKAFVDFLTPYANNTNKNKY